MYLSTGYVTYYLHLYFGLFGVLCLLMFFSTIFLISLNIFVPYDKMNILYQQKFKNKGLQEAELEEPVYESSKLKKWVEN